ncbi:hypothetical protein GLAREA_04946 [Glarea lozoyensis ATCC 20868]|uniref:Uncharacterized protein n=1 Tax=Glarea lozoyensis (strain ATCC 20868 / MF5171) TaxID=1116229 RepID=S3CR54_GLAL2|nr:uncharacterized protein GLAREA_04946 [Glarea lozoyensis ATCC 20868]EPE28155.1 hypothetical protein GLAREA_04946 [Glarea lozoyensis ATCC 20868]
MLRYHCSVRGLGYTLELDLRIHEQLIHETIHDARVIHPGPLARRKEPPVHMRKRHESTGNATPKNSVQLNQRSAGDVVEVQKDQERFEKESEHQALIPTDGHAPSSYDHSHPLTSAPGIKSSFILSRSKPVNSSSTDDLPSLPTYSATEGDIFHDAREKLTGLIQEGMTLDQEIMTLNQELMTLNQDTLSNISALGDSDLKKQLSSRSQNTTRSTATIEIGSPAFYPVDSESWETCQNNPCFLSENSQASLKMSSPEDSLDSDMFSISDCSDNFETNECEGMLHSTVNKVADQLYAEFWTCAQNQSSPGNKEQNTVPAFKTTTSAHSRSALSSGQKRKLTRDDEDGTGEDDSRPPRLKRGNFSLDAQDQKTFACPYWKKDATTHSACSGFELKRIRDVKLHLCRKHTPKFYCQRCQSITSPNEESLQSHVFGGNCAPRKRILGSWVSHEQRNELHKKSKSNTSVEDQWYRIWEVLFPGLKRPSSVYVDSDLAIRVRHFHQYCARQAPITITEVMESDPAWLNCDITEEQRRDIMRRSIAEGINNLFRDWLSDSSSSSRSPERESEGRMYDSRFETPESSNVDSGNEIGFQPSSSEPIAQRGHLSPPIGSSVENFGFQPVAGDVTAGTLDLQSDLMTTATIPTQAAPPSSFGSMDGWQEDG